MRWRWCMGGRADTGLVRHGAETARVEALFDGVPEPLICVREIGAGGRSLARIDDETVTAARLAAVVGPLVEIHGQHEQQRLLSAAWQRDILDTFGGHDALREDVARAVARLAGQRGRAEELAVDPAELQRRLELAQHAADEIEAANPQRRRDRRAQGADLSPPATPSGSSRCSRPAHDLLSG